MNKQPNSEKSLDSNKSEIKPQEDILKPDKDNKNIEKPKKKSHKIIWGIVIFVIIILPLLFFGYTGIFNIPGVTNLFNSRQPIDLGIQSSEQALTSALTKTPWTLEGEPADYTIFNKKAFIGSVEINHRLTSEELTSFLNKYLQSDPYVSEVQVKMIEGGVEASGMVNKYINAPVYVKVGITQLDDKSVKITLDKVKIGRLPVPSSILKPVEGYIDDLVKNRMAENTGFSIEILEYHDGYDIFRGTFPETVRIVDGPDWWN